MRGDAISASVFKHWSLARLLMPETTSPRVGATQLQQKASGCEAKARPVPLRRGRISNTKLRIERADIGLLKR